MLYPGICSSHLQMYNWISILGRWPCIAEINCIVLYGSYQFHNYVLFLYFYDTVAINIFRALVSKKKNVGLVALSVYLLQNHCKSASVRSWSLLLLHTIHYF